MQNGIADPVVWITKSRGWHWVGPDGWEVRRDVRHDDGNTQYIVWHNNSVIDYRATLSGARLAAESEMTRCCIICEEEGCLTTCHDDGDTSCEC